MTFDPGPLPESHQDAVLGPLVRVIEEACSDTPWALIGANAARLQGVDASSPNLEFITSEAAVEALSHMLGIPSDWGQGAHLAANRLHFMRHGVPVFVFADPVFHGPYESLVPRDVPSLWDARTRVELASTRPGIPPVGVLCTPLEWELILSVCLGYQARVDAIRDRMRETGYDSRLVVRLLRESHMQPATEEAVWAVLEAAS